MKIRAVTFDVGGTLIEPRPSVGHIYAEVAAQYVRSAPEPEEINRRFARVWARKGCFSYERSAWRSLVAEVFGVDEADPLDFFDPLYRRFSDPEVWRVYDDVFPAWKALREASIACAVISNWDERLRPLLDGLGLSRWLSVITISCEAGAAKPDRAIFAQTQRALGLSGQEILHVGDSALEDEEGARNADWRALLLDRSGSGGETGRLRSLSELPKVLDELK